MDENPGKPAYLVMAFQKGVGDHVACSMFVRNLARNRPGCIIDFGAFSPAGAELFKHNPYISSIHLLDTDYLKSGGKFSFGEKIRFIRKYRRFRYRKVYVLGEKLLHAVFAFLTGSPERIGHGNHSRFGLLSKAIIGPIQKNIIERFIDLLALDGLRVFDRHTELFLSDEEHETVRRQLTREGILQEDNILSLAPFAKDMRRTWGLDRFWEVAMHFANNGFKVLILGAPHDKAVLQKCPQPAHPAIVNLTGKFSILETAAAIQKSALFLGNDSGLGHVAGAVGTRSLILGYYVTRMWYPLASSVRTIIKDTGCASCDLDTCTKITQGKPECFTSIKVKEVIGKLTEMISESDIKNIKD